MEGIHPLFDVHILNEQGKQKAHAIAQTFTNCLHELTKHCDPASREFSIVKTKLEEAAFFAKKSMASHPDNHHSVNPNA